MDSPPLDVEQANSSSANPKSELISKLKAATNILVTVSRNPSVDQLAACIGLTLALNKLNKHTAAVFSGDVPSTLEFLKPEDTLEKTTDSLRDFIIALDKSKADKLRYKVEDNVVRIFITPYRTSINEADLEFSQGDFNVDLVFGIGTQNQGDLDEAIVHSGRILHDAPVVTVNVTGSGDLGSVNWQEPGASSLCELVTELVQGLGKDLLDQQIATALLTGIVAETERFSNEKTSPLVMNLSSDLMAAGANQQLVSSKLDEPPAGAIPSGPEGPDDKSGQGGAGHDGMLEIDHKEGAEESSDTSGEPTLPVPDDHVELDTAAAATPLPVDEAPAAAPEPAPTAPIEMPEVVPASEAPPVPGMDPLDAPAPVAPMPAPTIPTPAPEPAPISHLTGGASMLTEPPAAEGLASESGEPAELELPADPLSLPSTQALTHHNAQLTPLTAAPAAEPTAPMPAPAMTAPVDPQGPPSAPLLSPDLSAPAAPAGQTLKDIEAAVASSEPAPTASEVPPAAPEPAPGLNLGDVRDQVSQAFGQADTPAAPAPIQALNAQPLGDPLHSPTDTPPADATPAAPTSDIAYDPAKFGITDTPTAPSTDPLVGPTVTDSTAPPPVPPPIPFQFGAPPSPGA